MWIVGLDHVQLAAPPGSESDARRFFGELLGLREVPLGEQQLHVGIDEAFTAARKAHPALLVDPSALEPLAERLTGAGVEVVWDEELAPIRRFYARDPWGNRIELIAGAPAP